MRIGIDLGGTKIEAIALSEEGEILERQRVSTPSGHYDATISSMAKLVTDIESDTGLTGTVGVGIPGAISPETGQVKNANSVCLIGHKLDEDLGKLLNRPVRLANDADCFALSEFVDGAARSVNSCFGVILGTGTGRNCH